MRFLRAYIAATALLAAAVAGLRELSGLNLATIALALMLLVVLVAAFAGRGPALYAAIVAGLSFNFFFIQPFHTFRIHDPEDALAFFAFVLTAIVVGQLSTRLEMRVLLTEDLRKSEQLKTALLDAVTHDLRTPLTSIKAAITTVRRSELPRDAREEMYEVIEQESDRLDRFIGGMMDLARLEAGDLHPESTDVTAEEIIDDAVQRAAPRLRTHRVDILAPAELPPLHADPRLISQVLYTLLDNAAKNSPPESAIRIIASQTPPRRIVFAVTDEGPGIPAEMREQVFEKFFRVGDRSGYGVGLAVARGIVQAHGGRIWIESGPQGRGASVKFEVPSA